MKSQTLSHNLPMRFAIVAFLVFAAALSFAQTPVDDEGNPVGTVYADPDSGDTDDSSVIDTLSVAELETLVGPIALYPDDLLAIVLPASTYPLEIVQAARFLDDLESDSSLKPDDDWDDSVVALLNYPEVVRMMNDDIDWTWRLGEAVVAQQTDVVAAVEAFRDRAYAAGNLKSDERQKVTRTESAIEIEPIEDDVIYVPYYEPEVVVVRQSRPVYYYYPRAYPVYYYPYPVGYHFSSGYFWGVTTAYQIGWSNRYLHVQHYSYLGHPYFGRSYYDNYYWRRPSIQVFHTYYGRRSNSQSGYRNQHGDYWRPRHRGGARPGHYESRNRYYTDRRRSSSDSGYARQDRSGGTAAPRPRSNTQAARRDAGINRIARQNRTAERRSGNRSSSGRATSDNTIRFRARNPDSVTRSPGNRTTSPRRTESPPAVTPRAGNVSPETANRRTSNPRGDQARSSARRTESTRPAARTELRRNVERPTERRSTPSARSRTAPARIPTSSNRQSVNRSTYRQETRVQSQPRAPARAPARAEAPRRSSPPPAAVPNRSSAPRASSRPSADRARADRGARRGNERRQRN